MQRNVCFLCLLLGVLAIGCGSRARHPVVPVQGKIAFTDGKPLPAGTQLLFNPGEGSMGTATAITDASGAFQVTHSSGATGAEIGKYTIVLRAPEGDGARFYKTIRSEYYDAGVFAVEVKEGMPALDLKVKRK